MDFRGLVPTPEPLACRLVSRGAQSLSLPSLLPHPQYLENPVSLDA